MNIKCIIIDDEYPARLLLQDYISKFQDFELLGSFKSPLEAISIIQSGVVDLMFLDIQMPDLTGVEFLKTLNKKPIVVFTTAYMEYAYDGYQLDVMDYLLKPFSFERFVKTINKVTEIMTPLKMSATSTGSAINQQTEPIDKGFIAIRADHKVHRLKYDHIQYIEGLREYVTFFCQNEKIITLESLRNLEVILPQNIFIRVHKSYIVNINYVKSMYGNQLIMETTNKIVPIGKSFKDNVQQRLFNQEY